MSHTFTTAAIAAALANIPEKRHGYKIATIPVTPFLSLHDYELTGVPVCGWEETDFSEPTLNRDQRRAKKRGK